MAFNKARALESAQKFINQGKLAQAISQFQDILRREPRDTTVLMTLGDLYVQAGDISHAVEQFERLGQIFLTEGFASKAIATYKKIAKLQPAATGPLERLAELYAHQGVMSEARPLFLQIAETHLKQQRSLQALAVLEKLLQLEPDNLRVQGRLAELYQSLGQHAAAAGTWLAAAQRMLDRGNAAEAERLAARALEADPGNVAATTLRARALAAAGRGDEAIAVLEAASAPELTPLLVELQLSAGQPARALEAARAGFAAKPEMVGLLADAARALAEAGDAEAALGAAGEIRGALADAGEHDRLVGLLLAIVERLPGRVEPLEWLAEAGRRANDPLRLQETLGRLAEALEQAGERERAVRTLEELFERSGGDEHVRGRLNRLRAELGLEPVAEMVPSTRVTHLGEAARPAAEPELDPETRAFLSQALTDVDLYSGYGMTQKAHELLDQVLARVPGHAPALEKLLDLYVGAGDDQRTVDVAHRLEQLYRSRGDAGRAEELAEMRRRYQRVAGVVAPPQADEEAAAPVAADAAAPAEFAVPPAAAEAQEPPAEAGEAGVYEVDLSAEWAALAAEVAAHPPAPTEPPPEAPPEAAPPEPVAEAPAEGPAEEPAERPAEAPVEASAVARSEAVEEVSPEPPPAPETPAEEQEEEAAEYELEPMSAAQEPLPAGPGAGMTASDFLNELSAEVPEFAEAEHAPADAAPAAPEPPAAPPPAAPAPVLSQLHDVFEEFRSELGGLGEEEEDLEKHYNLGIAYREMGLMEEAIGEFQRVAKAVAEGRPFRYAMQCCTLLGLSFLDRGQPRVAAMWYERALATPGLDPETVMALRYDLGVALEQAGEAARALDSFLQVYAMNIDYRDVAERIAALEGRPAGPATQ